MHSEIRDGEDAVPYGEMKRDVAPDKYGMHSEIRDVEDAVPYRHISQESGRRGSCSLRWNETGRRGRRLLRWNETTRHACR